MIVQEQPAQKHINKNYIQRLKKQFLQSHSEISENVQDCLVTSKDVEGIAKMAQQICKVSKRHRTESNQLNGNYQMNDYKFKYLISNLMIIRQDHLLGKDLFSASVFPDKKFDIKDVNKEQNLQKNSSFFEKSKSINKTESDSSFYLENILRTNKKSSNYNAFKVNTNPSLYLSNYDYQGLDQNYENFDITLGKEIYQQLPRKNSKRKNCLQEVPIMTYDRTQKFKTENNQDVMIKNYNLKQTNHLNCKMPRISRSSQRRVAKQLQTLKTINQQDIINYVEKKSTLNN